MIEYKKGANYELSAPETDAKKCRKNDIGMFSNSICKRSNATSFTAGQKLTMKEKVVADIKDVTVENVVARFEMSIKNVETSIYKNIFESLKYDNNLHFSVICLRCQTLPFSDIHTYIYMYIHV